MKVYNVIMAGGGGTRFWPLSRQEVPKQLINLSGEDALINETINRIDSLAKKDDLFIVTNEKQLEALKDIVKYKCLDSNILPEPCARNTAAAIGFAAFNIMKKYGDGVMCVYPADHYIKDEKEFKSILEKAIYIAENNDKLVTIGITPTFPSTGYGYINFNRENTIEDVAYEVVEFVEKPNYEIAKEYVNSKKYVWNSGMFVWKVSKILEDFKRYLPKVYEKLEDISKYLGTKEEMEKIKEIYPTIQSISIDYGIMERSNDVIVVPGDFGWNDVGSWDSLGAIYPTDDEGNIKRGENITIDTKNSIIYSDDKLISTIGISDLIVVSTNDAVMVCRKDKAQDVKKIVEQLKEEDRQEYM
ncbi:mannose-1-phosphate guanylyltransferase [Clostridioides difficile]|uniref:mannose-1-phosphate guanylyltransferase n=1 Tax=Clostridioides difficile TaxID=1496 RepID=UPI0005DC6FA3|nr:mannose-1-phosphate guanylyltransferase [Clostridioides difficile]KJF63747.1 mannose-1-phosphate guanylyltransferase [Clostridioides difficile]MCK3749483.1 sugar phosphate nucleotidyltransferase [Clostridioides difficile]MCP8398932.1 sugar phosphate nucleotidyltransferase [Clostridioides difficile]MCP8416996.1 sugar phosphate nucleotidyltransferase [Clostridioides difficile]MCP8495208.1 sugar phosphate nucleotidyltransferase [Clostridioides difficile]